MGKLREEMIRDMGLRNLATNTQEAYLRAATTFAAYFMESPTKMGTDEVREFLLHLQAENYKPSSLVVYRAGLRFLYTFTLRRPGVVEVIPYPKKHLVAPRILTGSEIQRLLDAMPSSKHRAIFATTYSAGLRISETCSLEVDDIDSARGMIHIRNGKGGKDRFAHLSARLLVELRDYWKKTRPKRPFLFPGQWEDQPIQPRSFGRVLQQTSLKIGLKPHATPHQLRHSYATHMLELGADVRVIQILLGHESPKSTEHYITLTSRALALFGSPLDVLGTKKAKDLG